MDFVDENDENLQKVAHFTNWLEEDIEDDNGRELRTGKHVPQSASSRSRSFSEGSMNIPEGTTSMGQFIKLFITNAI